jgi:hypothetical protein
MLTSIQPLLIHGGWIDGVFGWLYLNMDRKLCYIFQPFKKIKNIHMTTSHKHQLHHTCPDSHAHATISSAHTLCHMASNFTHFQHCVTDEGLVDFQFLSVYFFKMIDEKSIVQPIGYPTAPSYKKCNIPSLEICCQTD